ncbi:MAG: hypothetical protein SPLM_07100 [Spiroplasma phoeniceum]|uniref:lipoprotein n=1 Tax=Spiroplasma phoeniceum TaxID=47835 RepID=UPI00327D3408
MKKILSILGAISLVGTSTTSLVSCDTPQEYTSQEYTQQELKELKEKNKINTTDETIKNNLEWIAPQQKPFNKVDNKYYYVVWRGHKNNDWKIIKFKNEKDIILNIDNDPNIKLGKTELFINGYSSGNDLCLQTRPGSAISIASFQKDNGIYFKSVYRWNLDTQEPNLNIDKDGNVIVKN